MRAAVRVEPRKVEILERPDPVAGPGEVLLRIYEVGICGGDLYYFQGEAGMKATERPLALGHEGVGRVEALGPGVTGLSIGDRVLIDPQVGWCGRCRYCDKGWRSLCKHRVDMSYGPGGVDGACRELVAINSQLCYLIPDSMSWTQAANVHGLAAVLRGFDRLPFLAGANVAIFGPGAAGLLYTQVARRMRGANHVFLVGRSDHRLKVGHELGADRVINTREEDVGDVIFGMTDGEGADIVIDTTANPQAQQTGLEVLRRRGYFLAYARGRMEVNLEFMLLGDRTIVGSTGVHGYMVPAIEAINEGMVQVDPLITHTFSLEETQAGFEQAIAPDKGNYIKGVIRVTED